ncbi:zinc finger Y-chromosomal protein-like [Coccinella septempunctata]|uniref:zinc finger Y-chromosomal protein-like n=1 Tax=Coccinella septempunctata TaxID=41139 RepID=UPI001D068C12|nr:zinc finger Y-chromosomal protein-like [Coccinella septempunctata]
MLSLIECNWLGNEICEEVNSIKSAEIEIIDNVKDENQSLDTTIKFETIRESSDFANSEKENQGLKEEQDGHDIEYEYVDETDSTQDDSRKKLEFKYVSNGEIAIKHVRSHKGKCGLCDGSKIVKAFTCELCDYVTVRKRDLKRHMDVVHYFKSTKYTTHNCSFCDFKSTKTVLEQHVKKMHPKEKSNTCNLCNYLTGQENLMKLHQAEAHSNYKCDLCDHVTDTESHLRYHVNYHHLKLMLFICDTCCYSTPKKKSLKLHIQDVHLKAKNHHCSFCDYSCTKNKYLRCHIENVHKKSNSYVCHICGSTLSRKNNLNFHIKSIHSECAEKTYRCEECEYSTWKKSDLKRHVKLRHLKIKHK